MPNPFFQFKQFTVFHDRCAMKVSTDSCLLGGWMAQRVAALQPTAERVLDIGAGTGLLSLMVAQQCGAFVTAVELDEAAAGQAAENVAASAWGNRIDVLRGDVKDVRWPVQFDVVVSNPPFFEDDLKSASRQRNLARHDDGLTLEELAGLVARVLTESGIAGVLLPYHRVEGFVGLAALQGLYCREQLLVRQTPGHGYFRGLVLLGKEAGERVDWEMSIRDAEGGYTPAFAALLSPYYLYL